MLNLKNTPYITECLNKNKNKEIYWKFYLQEIPQVSLNTSSLKHVSDSSNGVKKDDEKTSVNSWVAKPVYK